MTRIEPFTEDALLCAVLELAKLRGWLVYHVRNSRAGIVQGDVGFPDLVLARGGRVLFVELKRDRLRPSPAQQRWLDELESSEPGAPEVYVWRPDHWTSGEIERTLR